MVAAENPQFLWGRLFSWKCQLNVEITEQALLVRSLKRLKKAWKMFGKHREKKRRRAPEFSPLPGSFWRRCFSPGRLGRKTKYLGRRTKKKLIIYQRCDVLPELPGREAEGTQRCGALESFSPRLWQAGRSLRVTKSLSWQLPNPAGCLHMPCHWTKFLRESPRSLQGWFFCFFFLDPD